MNAPENIHCLAFNYPGVGALASETPLYFVKSKQAFCASGARVRYPVDTDFFWTEVELGIVLGDDLENASLAQCNAAIAGYVVCADLSCTNIHGRDHHLGFSKSRTNFCPSSWPPQVIAPDAIAELEMSTEINGKCTQTGQCAQMLYGPAQALHYLSRLTRLAVGDLVLTGTPAGWRNNRLTRGDRVRHVISQIGELTYDII
jgi:2-keto-4-pentenoate hydratase/2-oxohepta-3-ene-1,7-dioic acid hydratase in catechol pathway